MTRNASPISIDFHGDASLEGFMAALEPYAVKPLVIEYGGRAIRPGYHITEVKAGAFTTLDCGGNPDAWRETILQVEDAGADSGDGFMSAGKFRSILGQVARRIELESSARLTFEVGPSGSPMQVFDVGNLRIETDRLVLTLTARSAVCKPRHRARQEAAAGCCGATVQKQGCCV